MKSSRNNEITDLDRAEIARLIADGNTGGRVDRENSDGTFTYLSWNLDINTWTD